MPPPGDSRRFSFLGLGELWGKGQANSVGRSAKGEKVIPNLKVSSDKEIYRPGDSVCITIELENPARNPFSEENDADERNGNRFGLLVERLSFEFKGVGKLDHQWFATQKTHSGSMRRRGEHVFLDCSISPMVSNQLVLSGCSKTYMVQTVLPTMIPPSHKGATVRYLYYVKIALYGQWLLSEGGNSTLDSVRDPTGIETRLPLQIWGSQNGNDYLLEDEQSEGIFPSQTIQMDVYWKEMDGDSDWVRANEAYDGVEDDYDSSRDEVSSVSSYNPARESLHKALGSSLSLQSSSSRLPGRETLHAEADEVSHGSAGDVLSHKKLPATLSPRRQTNYLNPFSRDKVGSENVESAASEGFIRGRSYNIRLDDQVLLRFSPKKSDSNYYFSDMIGGTLTFFHEEAVRRCLEVSVTLEISETVNRRFVHPSRRNSPTVTKVQSDYYEVVADLLQTSFLFSIPMDGPMSFSTPHISVQWALRFEFYTTPKNVDWTRYDHPLLVEQRDKCEWVLPITVRAPQPTTSAAPSQTRGPSPELLWNRD